MDVLRNLTIKGAENRPLLLDIFPAQSGEKAPLIIFAHGFKGFKDWGHWDLVAKSFAEAGFNFLKFNFSHNGVTSESPEEFGDLHAFGKNTFSKENEDFRKIIDFATSAAFPSVFDHSKIGVAGHSRGGAMAIIQACNRPELSACVTWASVDKLNYAWDDPKGLELWNKQGVTYVINGRTGQNMPLFYSLYEDFMANESYFDVRRSLRKNKGAFCFIHGSEDPAVPYQAAINLKNAAPQGALHIINDANHVFGGSHPYNSTELVPHASEMVDISIDFFRKSWMS